MARNIEKAVPAKRGRKCGASLAEVLEDGVMQKMDPTPFHPPVIIIDETGQDLRNEVEIDVDMRTVDQAIRVGKKHLANEIDSTSSSADAEWCVYKLVAVLKKKPGPTQVVAKMVEDE